MRNFDQQPVRRGDQATRHAAAGEQAALARPEWLEGERTPTLEPECASRLEHTDPQSARRMEVDGFAQFAMLPLRMDAVGIPHLAAREVLEPLIAVEAAAVLAELSEPGPHLLDRRVDRHRVEDLGRVLGKQVVARQLTRLVRGFGR